MVRLDNDWDGILGEEFEKEYYLKLRGFLREEYRTQTIYPDMYDVFNALKLTSFSGTRVVVLGQDPYHGVGQAHGLSFSVMRGVRVPPSLLNIYKEINSDLGIPIPNHGELVGWARGGVLLLNACLTVRAGTPNSHKGRGWEVLTDSIISRLNEREMPVVFLLWGANAKAKAGLITNGSHLVLTSVHPSPLSAYNGFFGNRHFSRANEFLVKNGVEPVDWGIV